MVGCHPKKGLLLSQFKQLLMLYCARENAVMYDFIVNELNVLRVNQTQKLERDRITMFIKGIVDEGKAKWEKTYKNDRLLI